MCKKNKFVIVGTFLCAIPLLLNCLLQLENPFDFKIVENPSAGAPATWLAFWGSYIAACASFTMALVSYLQNKEIRRQNAARIKYECALKYYEEKELFIIDAEKYLSVTSFELLCKYDSNRNEMRGAINEYQVALNRLSALSIRIFKEKSQQDNEYYTIIEKIYGKAMELLDILYHIDEITFNPEYKEFINNISPENGALTNIEKFMIYTYKAIGEDAKNLHKIGFSCLRVDWENVITILKTIK